MNTACRLDMWDSSVRPPQAPFSVPKRGLLVIGGLSRLALLPMPWLLQKDAAFTAVLFMRQMAKAQSNPQQLLSAVLFVPVHGAYCCAKMISQGVWTRQQLG